MSYGHWGEYVSVAARRAQAERALVRLRKAGQRTSPVKIEGRTIVKTFWGKAWCANLETYKDYEYRLPRGRSYVRNGSVVDLQIAPCSVTAMVMGSSMYRISVTIAPLPAGRWTALCQACAGGIDSVVDLLRGRLSQSVMERMCQPASGLFPEPSEIKLSCSCPDYSEMCKHVAAALYGVGARLDAHPELLFRLRSVDEKTLVGSAEFALPFLKTGATKRNVLEVSDLSALFGLDIANPTALPDLGEEASTVTRRKARSPDDTDPVPTVSTKRSRPALKIPAARFVGKTPLKSNRTAKTEQIRGSKESQINREARGRLTANKPSNRSDTGRPTKAATKKRVRAKPGAQPLGQDLTRLSRSKPG